VGETIGKVGSEHRLPLTREIYRFSAHPLGNGFATSSKDSVLQIYGGDLKSRLETALALAPEVHAVQARLGFSDEQLKNHIRCVELSPDGSRYLATIVDEAWCISLDGDVIWGVRMPVKEGYQPSASSERKTETSAQVTEALELMGLALPVSPDDTSAVTVNWPSNITPTSMAATARLLN
jgi:hypothetical protein